MTSIGDLVVAVVIGVAASLIASVTFLVLLSRLKPKLLISDKIIRYRSSNGTIVYRIKVVNMTRYAVNNVRAEADIVHYDNAPGGKYKVRKSVKLTRSEVMQLLPFRAIINEEYEDYAYRFRTIDDIDARWDDSGTDFFRISVYAEHSVSGLSRVEHRTYHSKSCDIVTGSFKFGRTTEYVPLDPQQNENRNQHDTFDPDAEESEE